MEIIKNVLFFAIAAIIGVCVLIRFIFGYMAGSLKVAKAEDDIQEKRFINYKINNN